jgi:hypothetical protein
MIYIEKTFIRECSYFSIEHQICTGLPGPIGPVGEKGRDGMPNVVSKFGDCSFE